MFPLHQGEESMKGDEKNTRDPNFKGQEEGMICQRTKAEIRKGSKGNRKMEGGRDGQREQEKKRRREGRRENSYSTMKRHEALKIRMTVIQNKSQDGTETKEKPSDGTGILSRGRQHACDTLCAGCVVTEAQSANLHPSQTRQRGLLRMKTGARSVKTGLRGEEAAKAGKRLWKLTLTVCRR